MFFTELFGYIDIKKLETTAYHTQKNGQTEIYNNKTGATTRHCVTKHQLDLDVYVQLVIYANINKQVHRSTGLKNLRFMIN